MKVFVRTMLGETLKIEIEEDSVEALKRYLERRERMPKRYQILMFEGQVLVEGFKLSYYKVQDRSTLFVSTVYDSMAPRNLERLALNYLLNKKICRKCYGRLSPNATRCRKAKCGRTTDLRPKKPAYGNKYYNYK